MYSFDGRAEYTSVFSVTWSYRIHSVMLICCSRHISYYYQCWKQLCYLHFCGL